MREYVVFLYQYNDMPKAKWNAYRVDGDWSKTVDTLPSTVKHLYRIREASKARAIALGRKLFIEADNRNHQN
jgi:hypothetical protein